jgi:IS30 family transposase
MGWSPEQIAGRMELDGLEHAVSAESIYRHIFSPAGRRDGLPKYLPQRKSRRGRRARNGKREPGIPDRVPIAQRPAIVEERTEFGHWEGDLMHFRRQRDILLTLQERSTRLTLARRLHSKNSHETASAIIEELGGLPASALRTITHDNGGEFARHVAVKKQIGLTAYFCDPHSPWQRGTNENTNRLLRQYFPKGTDLSVHSQEHLDAVARELNERPRKTLHYFSPAETLHECVAAIG